MKLAYPLILASQSPRRKDLLATLGYDFTNISPPLEEPTLTNPYNANPIAWTESLAYYKARAVAEHITNAIIIGSDTVCSNSGEIIGKPKNIHDAKRILSTRFAGINKIITGIAVICPAMQKRIITHDITTISMRAMTDIELQEYLDAGTWKGKAGAYAYQQGGDRFALSVQGSESNIIGLPLEKLKEVFKCFQAK